MARSWRVDFGMAADGGSIYATPKASVMTQLKSWQTM